MSKVFNFCGKVLLSLFLWAMFSVLTIAIVLSKASFVSGSSQQWICVGFLTAVGAVIGYVLVWQNPWMNSEDKEGEGK